MRFLAKEVSPNTYVNIMNQYRPSGKVGPNHFAEINRKVYPEEYEDVEIAREWLEVSSIAED